jgi:hypothetical protein
VKSALHEEEEAKDSKERCKVKVRMQWLMRVEISVSGYLQQSGKSSLIQLCDVCTEAALSS